VPLIVDQSTCHPDAKDNDYVRVKKRFPDWGGGIEARLPQVREAEQQEHRSARIVVAASSFTRRTLIEHGVAPDKIRVNPYGVDCSRFDIGRRDGARPFRFVFVGAINAGKGIPLLLEAWRAASAKGGELWLIGPVSEQVASLIPRLAGLRCVGAIPHGEIPAFLKQCDVLVFPSYSDGFGLVILEAMACGLPVLTTSSTAGPDIITQCVDGWVIEPDDLARLTEIMSDCPSNRGRIAEMGRRARATAEKFTWSAYGNRWLEILREALDAPANIVLK